MDMEYLDSIGSICTAQSYSRGRRYYTQGRVSQVSVRGSILTATVRGSMPYYVLMTRKDGYTTFDCTCPYSYDGCCKHVVATLLHLYHKNPNGDVLLSRIFSPHGEYLEDIELADEPDDYEGGRTPLSSLRFTPKVKKAIQRAKRVATNAKPPEKVCRKMLDDLYKKAGNKSGSIPSSTKIDFGQIDILAAKYESEGSYAKAASTCLEMADYISDNIELVDDFKMYYTQSFQRAITNVMQYVRLQKPTSSQKRKYLSSFFERYIADKTDGFAYTYFEAMRTMSTRQEDLEYCNGLLDPYLKTGSRRGRKSCRSRENLLEARMSLLEWIDDDLLGKFLAENYKESEGICARYVWHMSEDGTDKALQAVRKGLKIFGDSGRLLDMLCYMHDVDDPRYNDLMRRMFIDTSNWGYLDRMKEQSSDWGGDLELILDDIRNGANPHMCIDVLLHEGMGERALEAVLEYDDMHVLNMYNHELGAMYPKEYYAEYARRILDIVDKSDDMTAYDEIRPHLDMMKLIPKHKRQFKTFMRDLGKRNAYLAESA